MHGQTLYYQGDAWDIEDLKGQPLQVDRQRRYHTGKACREDALHGVRTGPLHRKTEERIGLVKNKFNFGTERYILLKEKDKRYAC